MDLNETSAHALGAIFTLAVYVDEVNAGSKENHASNSLWGRHEQPVRVTGEDDSEEQQQEAAGAWDAYWGYDLVHTRGLLEKMYAKLHIKDSSWAGLKQLPQVAEASGFSQAVQQWRGILDPELQSLPTPKVCVEPPYDKPTDQQAAAQAASQVEEDDEDLRGDLQRIRGQKSGAKSRSVHGDKGHSLVEKTGLDQLSLDDQSTQHQQKPKRGEVPGQGQTSPDAVEAVADTASGNASHAGNGKSASELRDDNQQRLPSAMAFTAVTQLLEACVASQDMPQLEDIVQTDKKTGRPQPKAKSLVEKRGAEKAANTRWYDSRARSALRLVSGWLEVPWSKILLYECMLSQQAQAPQKVGDGKKELSAAEKRTRALKIGAAAAGGGVIVALTGGLALPALAAVAGTAMTTVGGASAAAAVTGIMGSSVGAAALIAGFGAGGAHVVGGKMARRVGDVKEFGFREIPNDDNYQSTFSAEVPTAEAAERESSAGSPQAPSQKSAKQAAQEVNSNTEQQSSSWFSGASKSAASWTPWGKKKEVEKVELLPIPVSSQPRADPKLTRTIAVAGSIAAPDDFVDLWRGLSNIESERFALVWETQELVDLTNSIMNMLINQAYSRAGKYLIENFVIHGLVGAVALPMTVINVAGLIDNTWSIVMNRAARAGELLAHLLMSGAHGDCPVILVGNSMGSRCKCKGIVQHAIMLGTPVDVIHERWVMARSVVSGRCINGYCKKDWVLALNFRARQGTFRPAAGLGPVPVAGIENVDLTDIVHGHGDYLKKMDAVLQRLHLAQPSTA